MFEGINAEERFYFILDTMAGSQQNQRIHLNCVLPACIAQVVNYPPTTPTSQIINNYPLSATYLGIE